MVYETRKPVFSADISTGYKILEHMDNSSMLSVMLNMSKLSTLGLIENEH